MMSQKNFRQMVNVVAACQEAVGFTRKSMAKMFPYLHDSALVGKRFNVDIHIKLVSDRF
jgi:hypothetical protein